VDGLVDALAAQPGGIDCVFANAGMCAGRFLGGGRPPGER